MAKATSNDTNGRETNGRDTTSRETNGRDPGREKALNLVLTQIDRTFGKGTIMRLGDATRMKIETIPSGALTLDLALGGGFPKGRIIEV
ncbi:hypothetical protein H6F80_12900, partial [Leptolyngbya sp. FACHB-711]|nr:hypothetical protein [Leptolyngbya sp. FACHB-711]